MLHNQLCDAIATFSGKKGLITLEQAQTFVTVDDCVQLWKWPRPWQT